jgi:hypothetical protein
MNERRDAIRRQCEELGLAGAKAHLIHINDFSMREHFLSWIAEEEQKAIDARDEQQRIWNEQALEAAKLSAATSREAAIASKRSAFWTMWAAIAAAVSAAIPLLQALHILPAAT